MSNAATLRAALAVAELEEELVAAKADDSVTPELKHQLRDARREHRELREAEEAGE